MEKRRMGLDALRPGEYGVLREILMPGEAKARMEELGLLPETELSCLYRAPHASPAHMRLAEQCLHCGKGRSADRCGGG